MQLVSTQLEYQLFTAGSKLLENIPPTQATLFQHVKRALLQASFYWHQATLVQQNIPDFSEWGWQKDGTSTWQQLWSTLSDNSMACSILLHCGCPKACTGRCKYNRAGDRYTALANVKECFIVNKTQLASFFVYRRKSLDRLRIVFRYIDSMCFKFLLLFMIQFQGYTLVSIFMAITCFCFRRWSIQGEGRVFMM